MKHESIMYPNGNHRWWCSLFYIVFAHEKPVPAHTNHECNRVSLLFQTIASCSDYTDRRNCQPLFRNATHRYESKDKNETWSWMEIGKQLEKCEKNQHFDYRPLRVYRVLLTLIGDFSAIGSEFSAIEVMTLSIMWAAWCYAINEWGFIVRFSPSNGWTKKKTSRMMTTTTE